MIEKTDIEILKEITDEFGFDLPIRRIGEVYNESKYSAKEDHGRVKSKLRHEIIDFPITIDNCCSHPCTVAFIDSEDKVVAFCAVKENLTKWPTQLEYLKKLKGINVGINKLTTIPKFILDLPELEKLVMLGNKIKKLPKHIIESKIEVYYDWPNNAKLSRHNDDPNGKWSGIVLRDNPLSDPPVEIVSRGINAIIDYLESAQDGMRPLHEVKLILVGDGGAGKTSLVKRLRDKEFDPVEGQTKGINIDAWKIKFDGFDVNARIWDFGGQEIMHSTHQFFLSERSVYILVLDGRKEEDAEYWVKHVTAFGGNSPILIVLNKMDENPSFDLNEKFLREKYKNIQGFYKVSCRNGNGIFDLTKSIKASIHSIDIVKSMWPQSWFTVKAQLELMGKPYIDYDEYTRVCEEAGIEKENSKDTLVKYLHDLGVVVRFEDFELSNTHVLEPRWLTEAVYRIINSDILAKNKGVLILNDLKKYFLLGKILQYMLILFILMVILLV